MRFLAAAGLVMVLTGLGAYYATGRELSVFSIANLAAGPLCLLAAGLGELRQLRGFSGRPARRVALRWSAILAAVATAGIGLNVLASGWSASLDLTVERTYTLADQTRSVCRELEQRGPPAPELLFFEDSHIWKEIAPLASAYQAACPAIRIQRLRSDSAPPAARPLLRAGQSTVLHCLDGRCDPVGFPTESNLTAALLRGARERTLYAYFTLGHGEVNLADEGRDGFSEFAQALDSEGIAVRGWIGASQTSIPSDASLVISAAPERNLLPAEIEMLERYLEEGGRLLALLEPGVSSNLLDLLERFGFGVPEGIVVDRATSPLLETPRPVSLIVNDFAPLHAVVRSMSVRTMLLLPSARPVLPVRKPQPDDQIRALLFSSARAWLESDVGAALGDRGIRADEDELSGQPIPLAAAGEYPRGERRGRIVVIGDRDFASNRLISSLYNRDLLMNSVLWLAEDEIHIALRPKFWTPDHYPIAIQETLAYFYFLAFAVPEALLLLGIGAWYRQRG